MSSADLPTAQVFGSPGKEQKCLLFFPPTKKLFLGTAACFSCGAFLPQDHLVVCIGCPRDSLHLNSPEEVMFIKAWEQSSKALRRPGLRAKCALK